MLPSKAPMECWLQLVMAREFFFLLTLSVLLPSSTCTVYTIRPNYRFTLTPTSTVTFTQQEVSSGSRCVIHCRRTSGCVSVNTQWNSVTSTLTCELLSKYLHESPGSLTSAQGWRFMQEDPVYTDSSWALVFRVTTGISKNVWDTFNDNSRHDDASELPGCVRLDSALPCQSHFRSYVMDRWSNINQVRLRLYKGGAVAAEVTFNGQGSTRLSWCERSRVLNSTWTDLTTIAVNYFSVVGIPHVYRRFYLSHIHEGCPKDKGWMVLSDHHTLASVAGQCDWEKRQFPLPVLYYCPHTTACTWQTTYATADFMTMHVTFST